MYSKKLLAILSKPLWDYLYFVHQKTLKRTTVVQDPSTTMSCWTIEILCI